MAISRNTARWLASDSNPVHDLCESPIEKAMACALLLVFIREEKYMSGFFLRSQARVGKYRADFLICWGSIKIVVECDGHEYHEKTKEQAARDKSRDRYMAINGYTVLRFTGSEIYNSPMSCAEQVYDCFDGRLCLEIDIASGAA